MYIHGPCGAHVVFKQGIWSSILNEWHSRSRGYKRDILSTFMSELRLNSWHSLTKLLQNRVNKHIRYILNLHYRSLRTRNSDTQRQEWAVMTSAWTCVKMSTKWSHTHCPWPIFTRIKRANHFILIIGSIPF